MTAIPQTSAFLWGDRHFPPAVVAQQAKALQDSGVVDFMSQSTQMLLTLAHMAEGNVVGHVGGGEVKQTGPFGYKRSRRIKSLADFVRISDEFFTADGPSYAEAGVSFVAPADYLPVVCDHEDAAQGLGRSIACLAAVKASAGA